jgi:hypothetical protein
VAEIARVRVDLPVFIERNTCQEDGSDRGKVACEDKGESDVDAQAVAATKAVLLLLLGELPR